MPFGSLLRYKMTEKPFGKVTEGINSLTYHSKSTQKKHLLETMQPQIRYKMPGSMLEKKNKDSWKFTRSCSDRHLHFHKAVLSEPHILHQIQSIRIQLSSKAQPGTGLQWLPLLLGQLLTTFFYFFHFSKSCCFFFGSVFSFLS